MVSISNNIVSGMVSSMVSSSRIEAYRMKEVDVSIMVSNNSEQ